MSGCFSFSLLFILFSFGFSPKFSLLLNVNARSLADVDVEQAADVPEVVAHSDNAVDVGVNDERYDGGDDVSPLGISGLAIPVDDNCVGNLN